MHPIARRPVVSCEEFARIAAPYFAVPLALWTALVAGALLLGPPAQAAETPTYEAAHAEYEVGHYDKAFATFARLADDGHCDAARIARQMAAYGRELFATRFEVSAERQARWRELPSCSTPTLTRN